MNLLWHSTNDGFYKKYYEEWNAALNKPYLYRVLHELNYSGLLLFFLFWLISFLFGFSIFRILKKRLN